MLDCRLVGRMLLVALVATALVGAQAQPFAFVKDQIPAEAGPVLGLADFDQDGDIDLLTNGTGIYLNDGHGNFTPHPVLSAVSAGFATIPPPPSGAQPITSAGWGDPGVIADLNGDSFPDVVSYQITYQVTNLGLTAIGSLRKWMNQGNGVLVWSPLLPGGYYGPAIRTIALGDVDLDGDPDVVIGGMIGGYSCGFGAPALPLALLRNDGLFSATFTDVSSQLPAQTMLPSQVGLHDLDGDGDLDLVCGGDNQLGSWPYPIVGPLVYLNGGNGVFSQTPITLPAPATHDCFSIGDVDGDGLPDLAFGASPRQWDYAPVGPPSVLRNTGGGVFVALPAPAAGTARSVPHLLDLDGDGSDELVQLAYESTTVHTLGSGSISAPTGSVPAFNGRQYLWGPYYSNVTHSAAADLDGDGDRDLVVYTAQGNQVLFNGGYGNLVVPAPSLSAPWTLPVFGDRSDPVDVDHDGDLDLALMPVSGAPGAPVALTVALNDGTGSLAAGATVPCTGIPLNALLGPRAFFDVDQDGDVDLYVTEPVAYPPAATTVHYVLKNNSGGSFSLWQILTHGGAVYASNLRPGDLDGDGDLDLVISGSPLLVLWNDGTGTFQVAANLGAGDAVLVDVDGDGDLDVVNATSPASKLFLNDGTGSFTQSAAFPVVSATMVVAGDFNADGTTDLLFGSTVLLNNAVLLNNGAGVFWFAGGIAVPTSPGYLAFAALDIDLDGLCDVVDSEGRLYRNFGLPFAPPVNLPSTLTNPIVHADFDRDGDEDLVARGPSILTNMTRQLSRGKPARPGRPASLELAGPPGAPWLLFASNGTGNLPLPTLGTVLLDPASAQLTHAGVFSATGGATLSGITPTAPAWAGVSVFWQAVVYHPQGARLTGLEVTTIGTY